SDQTSDFLLRPIRAVTISSADKFLWHTPKTAWVNGISTPWAVASWSIEAEEITPSATCPFVAAAASPRLPPCPRRQPQVRLRERSEAHVATKSPKPANPAKVLESAPSAPPSRVISASPRVMSVAMVLAPIPMPVATPQARAMTFLHAPPISQPTTSVLVYGRK